MEKYNILIQMLRLSRSNTKPHTSTGFTVNLNVAYIILATFAYLALYYLGYIFFGTPHSLITIQEKRLGTKEISVQEAVWSKCLEYDSRLTINSRFHKLFSLIAMNPKPSIKTLWLTTKNQRIYGIVAYLSQ